MQVHIAAVPPGRRIRTGALLSRPLEAYRNHDEVQWPKHRSMAQFGQGLARGRISAHCNVSITSGYLHVAVDDDASLR